MGQLRYGSHLQHPNHNCVNDIIYIVRDTIYGLTWDVKTVENAANIAYSSLPIPPHMDLMYLPKQNTPKQGGTLL